MLPKPLSATRNVLALLCLMYFITYVDRVNVSTAATAFKEEFGLSNTQVGFVFSAFAYPYLIFQIIGGWLGDRFGARRTLSVCGVVWAGATMMTGLAQGFVSLVLARVLLGFGEGATFPAATRAMSNWTASSRRGFAQGITHSWARHRKRCHTPAGGCLDDSPVLAGVVRHPGPGQFRLGHRLGAVLSRQAARSPAHYADRAQRSAALRMSAGSVRGSRGALWCAACGR